MALIPSSYRDPSGHVFTHKGKIFRQVNVLYKDNYDLLVSSGLLKFLTEKNLLIPHKEVGNFDKTGNVYATLEPLQIPQITYPYEWCFSALKDAALLTLTIQKHALAHGMVLKDATSFNVQFYKGKPIFIDTLSFEKFARRPWVAYKQFVEQFLGPLALGAYSDFRLTSLLSAGQGSIPLDLILKLLPLRAKLNPSLLIHIYLHAKSQTKYSATALDARTRKVDYPIESAVRLAESLADAVEGLSWKTPKTVWTEYYEDPNNFNYEKESIEKKRALVSSWLTKIQPKVVLDAGANTGEFSKISADLGFTTVAVDTDGAVIEKLYSHIIKTGEEKILPLYADIAHPTPQSGFDAGERPQFFDRIVPDTILALALLHHLAISNNLPFGKLAEFFSRHCRNLIIEYVPKEDRQTQKLLRSREDIFSHYTKEDFEKEFGKYFRTAEKNKLPHSERIMYYMKRT